MKFSQNKKYKNVNNDILKEDLFKNINNNKFEKY